MKALLIVAIGQTLAMSTLAAAAQPSPRFVIGPGQEQYFLGNVSAAALEPCRWSLEGIDIQPEAATYRFKQRHSGQTARVILTHPSTCQRKVIGPGAAFCLHAVGATSQGSCSVARLGEVIAQGISRNRAPFPWSVPQETRRVQSEARGRPGEGTAASSVFPTPSPWSNAQEAICGLLLLLLVTFGASEAIRLKLWRLIHLRTLLLFGAVVILGLVLRIIADDFPSSIRLSYATVHRWGAATAVLHRAADLVVPLTFDAVVTINRLIGALTPVLVGLFAWRVLNSEAAAVAGAAALALHPIAVRFSASDSAHIPLTFSLWAALCCAVAWVRSGRTIWIYITAGWLAVGSNLRAEACIFALGPALLTIALDPKRVLAHWRHLSLAALLLLGACLYPLGDVLTDLSQVQADLRWTRLFFNPFFDPPITPLGLKIAAVVGIGALLYQPASRATAAALICTATVLGLATIYDSRPGFQVSYRYFTPQISLFCLLAGYGAFKLARLACPPRWSAAALGSVLCAACLLVCLPSYGFLKRTWTHQLEFDFFRMNLAHVVNGCTIVTRAPFRADSGFEPTPSLSVQVGRRHRWMDTETMLAQGLPPGCVVFYQSATCFARDRTTHSQLSLGNFRILPECKRVRERYNLEALAEARLPARPFTAEQYTRDPVPVGFYRLTRPASLRTRAGSTPP